MNESLSQHFFIKPPVSGALNVAFVAGPIYDPLYELIPEFERQTGKRVNVAARLVHPELNIHLEQVYQAGRVLTTSSLLITSMCPRNSISCSRSITTLPKTS